MKATDVIRRDHRAAEELLNEFRTAAPEQQKALEHKLFTALERHELMEDTYFYPVLKEKAGDEGILREVLDEQTSLKMKTLGSHAIEAVAGPNENRVETAMEQVLAHAQKEETLIFPLAERLLGEEEMEEIGDQMEPHSAVAAQKEKA